MELKIYRRKWLRWSEEKRRYFRRYLKTPNGTFMCWMSWYPEDLYCFIAEVDGNPIGMALVYGKNFEAGIYIRPKFRRKGIGYKLLKQLHNKFPKAVVAHHNKKSYKLFSKFNRKRRNLEYSWIKLGRKR